ncbi:histidine phosphatase family protein [uncultured Roseobacter sp.]|uniref:histidine phosphatase family protein n=1 Tax=uncultured Roseobacter sp. TaxID=114847 RepID=UPI002624941D|nr:histidine phosphatase family protein [uncultured Roseobacter sp.]
MTIWHWVRHGPTHEKAFVGWRDVPADLSDKDQIARLRAYLPDTALMVSSDLIRASATADAVQASAHTRLPHVPDIREFNFGVWDGLHFSKVAERHPELSRAYWETPGDVAPPQGESWNMAAKRVNSFVDRINAAHPSADIIAVAHIGVILTQVQRGLGVSAYEALSHSIDNLSTTRIIWSGGQARVETINHCL